MNKIEVTKIKVDTDRARKAFENLDALAKSIELYGQLQPILVDREYNLICGERRFRAIQLLGWEFISVEFSDEIEIWRLRAMELEENLQREQLTYQEECEAKLRLHELYQEKYGATTASSGHGGKREAGGWTIDKTAEFLGESHGGVVKDLQVARAIRANPELGKKETREACFKAITVEKDLNMKREIAEVLAKVAQEKGEEDIQIINGDSKEVLKQFPDDSFDFCITDPQYGIGVHDLQNTFPNRGEVRQGIEFDDTKPVLQSEVKPIMTEIFRLLKVGSHCYVFFAIARYTEVKLLLEEAGFWVCPTPLLWIKNNALNLRPHLTYPVNYEPIFYCSKGYPPRPLSSIQPLSTFEHPIMGGTTKLHPTQKPLKLIEWLMQNCSQPKERGIDPFLGSGTFTKASKNLGRLAVGIELDEVWWLAAKQRLEDDNDTI